MFSDARIDVHLRLQGGTVAAVRLDSSRRTDAAAPFAGRTPEQVLALVPTLFALCGTAQALASRAAFEAAAGIGPDPARRPFRRLSLLAETVAEHATTIARDWPALIGESPNLAAARDVRGALADIRKGPCSREAVEAALASAEAAIARQPVDRLIERVAGAIPGFGRMPFRPMPAGGPPDLADRLAEGGDYLAAPDCGGIVFETGALARHHAAPALAELMAAHGNGLLPRMTARRVEMTEALREMHALVQDLSPCAADAPITGSGRGLGVVEAARGLLAHRVELKEGRVASYRILAPTEWNFHPEGPLASGLLGAPADDIEVRARALAAALDPCVACTIAME